MKYLIIADVVIMIISLGKAAVLFLGLIASNFSNDVKQAFNGKENVAHKKINNCIITFVVTLAILIGALISKLF